MLHLHVGAADAPGAADSGQGKSRAGSRQRDVPDVGGGHRRTDRFGRLADLIGAIPAYLTASAWQTLLVLGFVFIDRLGSFYIYAAIYGFGYAGVMTSSIVTTRNLTAPARRASSLGIVSAFAYLGHGLGGWQGGYFFDLTGGYQWTYANAAIAGVINLIIVAALWLTIKSPASLEGSVALEPRPPTIEPRHRRAPLPPTQERCERWIPWTKCSAASC